jgi:predicted CopG family antitoxin
MKAKKYEGTTTIRITKNVHDKIGELGKWGESMSDIIDRLIEDHYELERLKAK